MSGESSKLSKEELREDEFVEWIMQAADYVKERAQLFIGGLVVFVLLILGINYIIESQEQAKVEAASRLGDLLMAEEEGDAAGVISIAEDLISRFDGTPAAAQGVLVLANRYFAQENFAEGQRLYEKYLEDYGQSEILVFGAWSGLASCLEAQGQTTAAAEKYLEFATGHPQSLQAAMAVWEAARCYGQLGDISRQKELLERVMRDFPELPLAARAKASLAMF
jgi:tetratricopeptide (TPR) repeat protein